MSTPPPSSAPPGSGVREHVLELLGGRSGDVLRLSAMGLSISFERALQRPLRLPLGTLQLGLIDPGPARAEGVVGRFPILKRVGRTTVVPRRQGVEGWLWTSTGGSALTVLGDGREAPNVALLFTRPLGLEAVVCFVPEAARDIAARSPLGSPTIYGLLLRVADTVKAEDVFRAYGLLRPLTDREVPPTLRRTLPADRSPDLVPDVEADTRAATSVAPPCLG